MRLCDSGHDEICFEGRKCPVCEKIDEIDKLETQNGVLYQRIEDLELEKEEDA
jgi:hypothetical protein